MKPQFIQKWLLIPVLTLLSFSSMFGSTIKNTPGKIYNGYVVTIEGDTIRGKLQMLSPSMNQVKIKFIDPSGEKIMYKAKDLEAYAFQTEEWNKDENVNIIKWIRYTKKTVERPPIPFSGTEILLQQEVLGTISIYNFYIETRTSQSMEHIIYLEKSGVLYEVNRDNYRDVLKALTSDVQIIHQKISEKGFGFKYLNQIIIEYNQQGLEHIG